jgi:alkylation response protein AidB-like acyl-CoA dehydrogenase
MSDSARKDSPEQAAFRAHCRDWLSANMPPPSPVRLPQSALEIMTREQLDYLCAWQKAAYDAGLVGCDYPVEHGGGGRTDCQRVANEEMQRSGAPYFPNIIGLGMAAPTVFYHGSDALKRQVLPALLSGEEIWCQGFSEPGAGSDLASVQTFAERRGDRWVINGHKVWTSLAHFASWMILLARTDKSSKYDGLSYFVVPIRAALGKGVTVRPLIKMTGETGFNEVLFEDLEIDDGLRLDEVGKGWTVAMTTLAHERGAGILVTPQSGGSRRGDGDAGLVSALVELARQNWRNGQCAADDPVIRDRLAQLLVREEGFRLNLKRARVAGLTDHPMRLALQYKLLMSEIAQEAGRLGMDIAGNAGSLYVSDPAAPHAGRWPLAYMNSFGFTIAAGTSEVQRNILGERVLGLAKTK